MYNDEPRVFVTIERTVNLGNYESAKVAVGLSQIPFNATEDLIEQMLSVSGVAFDFLRKDLRKKVALVRREKEYEEGLVPSDEAMADSLKDLFGVGGEQLAIKAITAAAPAAATPTAEPPEVDRPREATSPAVIPTNVNTGLMAGTFEAFGHQATGLVAYRDQLNDPITTVNADNQGGGQLKALNAVLTNRGFANEKRHTASVVLLKKMNPRHPEEPRNTLGTLLDLKKGEASLLIDWLGGAPPASIEALSVAVENYDPFEDL